MRSASSENLAVADVVQTRGLSVDGFDFLLLVIAVTSAVMMALIASGRFEPSQAAVLGLAGALLIMVLFRARPAFRLPPLDRHFWLLAAIGLVAIALRMDLYPHFIAGQDQGVYVSMSEVLRRAHAVRFVDELRQTLPQDLRQIYDDGVMPGMVLSDPGTSTFYVDFYPMHPAWMAMARSAFGFGFHTLSLLAFALVALVALYRLTAAVANDRLAAVIALSLCAVNPQLAFLAKFPLSETLASAFTIAAAYAACKAVAARERRERLLYLLISVLLVNALLYVRISFFVFVPLLCCAYALSYGSTVARDVGSDVRKYVAMLFLLFLVSLAYYDHFAPRMVRAVLVDPPSTPARTAIMVSAILLLTVLAVAGGMLRPHRRLAAFGDALYAHTNKLVPYAVPVALLITLPWVAAAVTTGHLVWRFEAPPGLVNIKYSVAYRLLLIVSPFVLAYLLVPRFVRTASSKAFYFLMAFFAGAWVVTLLWLPTLPYLYYHGRYISAEIVPCVVVLASVVIAWAIRAGGLRRRVAIAATGLALLYGVAWSAVQVGRVESDHPEFMAEIDRAVGPRDLLVVLGDEINVDIATPLRHYLGKQVFYIRNEAMHDGEMARSVMSRLLDLRGSTFDRVLLLTAAKEARLDLGAEYLSSFKYESSFFTNGERAYQAGWLPTRKWWTFLLPAKNVTIRRDFSLFQVQSVRDVDPALAIGCVIEFGEHGLGRYFLRAGWSTPEQDSVWSDGSVARLQGAVRPAPDPEAKLSLQLSAHAYEKQRALISFNGVDLGSIELASVTTIRLPLPARAIPSSGDWTMEFRLPDAHSPASRGASGDARVLGIGVHALSFVEGGSPSVAPPARCGAGAAHR